MKRFLFQFFCLLALAGFIGLIPFLPRETTLLSPEEQQFLKKGKTFWTWNSAYGQLDVHYIEKGTGSRHLILLHGFRANTFTWRFLIDPLAQAGYHVWAVDLIGYGLSDKPASVPYDTDFFIEQIQSFMAGNRIESAHFIGNSMGGGLALAMAAYYPQQVNSLVLINALGYPLDLSFYLIIGKNFGHLLVPFLGPTMIRQGMEEIVYHKESLSDEQIEAYVMPYRFPGGTLATTITMEKFDNQRLIALKEHYKHIHKPLLVIWGERDRMIPFSHFKQFMTDFPSCDHTLIPDCGHIPQEETPEKVLKALIPFLRKQTFSEIKTRSSIGQFSRHDNKDQHP